MRAHRDPPDRGRVIHYGTNKLLTRQTERDWSTDHLWLEYLVQVLPSRRRGWYSFQAVLADLMACSSSKKVQLQKKVRVPPTALKAGLKGRSDAETERLMAYQGFCLF